MRMDRDIALDLDGIERLLTQEATPQDRRELASWSRRLDLFARIVRRRGAAARPARELD